MKLVMTLLARDEADIVEAQIDFHLNAGVDFVIATDNRSQDGTTEILETYRREGCLHLITEPGHGLRQREWVTRMARLAASEFAADWVVNSDADEFWWPSGGSLRELLEDVPGRYGIVGAIVRQFLARPAGEPSFAERMTVRLAQLAPINDPASPFKPKSKIVHRADPRAVVVDGNHALLETSLQAVPGWCPIEMFHFGTRSLDQFERKVITMKCEFGDNVRGHYARAFDAYEAGELRSFYEAMVVDDDDLSRGISEGTLAVDTRLRDALRAGGGRSSNAQPLPTASAYDASRALEVSVLAEADVVRLQRSLDDVERRVQRLERSMSPQGSPLSSRP